MVYTRVTNFPQLLAILTLVWLTFGKSFSHARRAAVLEVSTVVAIDKEFAVHGGSSFSSQKVNIVGGDVLPSYKIGGRRMSYGSTADRKGQNIGVSSSAALIHGAAGEEKEEHWKQVLMAFAVDYSSPRAHPPSHN